MDFKELLQKLNINLSDEMLDKFNTYYNFLVDYNEKVNLTAITEYEEVFIKHFYDSLTLSLAVDFSEPCKCCDVGAGAGFPTIPNAICFSNVDVTIIDALNKRIVFLNELINKLDLKNAHAYHKRAEEYALEKRESFDVVTARAVARFNILAELCMPLVKVGGVFVAMKGQDNEEEITEGLKAIKILGGELVNTIKCELPNNLGSRTIYVIKKVSKTPNKYPRAFAQIKKAPIC